MGTFLHVVGGLVVTGLAGLCLWSLILSFAIYGFFREKRQHPGQGLFGWITKHRMLEAMAWPMGALIACVAWIFI